MLRVSVAQVDSLETETSLAIAADVLQCVYVVLFSSYESIM